MPEIKINLFPKNPFDAISVIPNILLAFVYQVNFFPIYKGLAGSTDKKMLNSSLIGTTLCFTIYSITGLLGYLSYGNDLKSSNFL